MQPSILFFIHLLLASRIASLLTEQADLGLQRRVDKGKQPAKLSTPEPGDEAPLPGRSGISTQQSPDGTSVHTAHYGDDYLRGHMNHVDRNYQLFPENRGSYPHSAGDNRPQAMARIPVGPPHHVTGEPQDRDEKLLNMLEVPDREHRTTVEYRPKTESRGKNSEGVLTSELGDRMDKDGGRGRLRTNPGWSPLDANGRSQQRAHSAEGRLPSGGLTTPAQKDAVKEARKKQAEEAARVQQPPLSPKGNWLAPRPSWIPSSNPGVAPRPPPKSSLPVRIQTEKSTSSGPKAQAAVSDRILRQRPQPVVAGPSTARKPSTAKPAAGPPRKTGRGREQTSIHSQGTPQRPANLRPVPGGNPALMRTPRPSDSGSRYPPRPQAAGSRLPGPSPNGRPPPPRRPASAAGRINLDKVKTSKPKTPASRIPVPRKPDAPGRGPRRPPSPAKTPSKPPKKGPSKPPTSRGGKKGK
ncbi:hypothetical protein MMC17_010099 [Xylographa soralifera]|nr:hypothetical protein [Xylographa soralifera]